MEVTADKNFTVNAPVEGKGAHCAVHEPVAATAEGATLDASGGGTDEGVATHGAPDTLRPAAVAAYALDLCLSLKHFHARWSVTTHMITYTGNERML